MRSRQLIVLAVTVLSLFGQYWINAGKTSLKTTADFALQKLSADDSKHNFVVWADTQMISKKDCVQLKAESVPDLKALVQSYPALVNRSNLRRWHTEWLRCLRSGRR